MEDYEVLKPIGTLAVPALRSQSALPLPLHVHARLTLQCARAHSLLAGKGKFSTVYRAVHRASGNVVALKKIQIADMVDKKKREKCLKEVRLLQSLDHPNIIRYLDSFIHENELIIVFEWAEVRPAGGSLCVHSTHVPAAQAGDLKRQIRKAIQKGARFDERVIWKYFMQAAEGGWRCRAAGAVACCSPHALEAALKHMHDRRVMHRDLKVRVRWSAPSRLLA